MILSAYDSWKVHESQKYCVLELLSANLATIALLTWYLVLFFKKVLWILKISIK